MRLNHLSDVNQCYLGRTVISLTVLLRIVVGDVLHHGVRSVVRVDMRCMPTVVKNGHVALDLVEFATIDLNVGGSAEKRGRHLHAGKTLLFKGF